MTVIEKLNPKVQYNGPIAINDTLSINFPYTNTEDVKCVANNRQLVYNRDYTVLNQTLTIKVAIPRGQTITIYRSTPLDQQAEFPQNNRFNSAKLNASLDKICMQQQEQNEKITRSVKVPIDTNVSFEGSLPTPIPNRILRINEEASGFEFVPYDLDERLDTFEDTVTDNITAGQEAIENSFEEFKNETNITINNISNKASNAETIANSANTKSENAVTTANTASTTSTTALNTSNEAKVIAQNAVTTANTAANTSTTALNTSDEAKVIAQNAVDISNSAVTTANTTVTRVDEFEEDINSVIEAADKINDLEEGIEQATNAATIAQNAADDATRAANEAVATLDSKADKATTYTKTESDNLLNEKVNVSDMVVPPFVNKNGDTITGSLYIKKENGGVVIQDTTLDYATIPAGNHTATYRNTDKNGRTLGDIRFERTTDGTQRTSIVAANAVNGTNMAASLSVQVDKDGNASTTTNQLATNLLRINNGRITCNQTSNTQPIHINHSSSNGFVSVYNKANDMDFTSTTAPSANQMAHRYLASDKNGQHINTIETGHLTNNNFQTLISTRRSIGGTIKTVNLAQIINPTGITNTLITGSPLDVQNDTFNFVARSATMDITQTPTTNQYVGYEIKDKNNARCAYIGVANRTTGTKTLDVQFHNAKILNIIGMTGLLINGKNVPYVTEQVSGEYNWYRIWSDGRLEQGGRLLNNTTTSGNLLFPQAFINENYTLIVSDTEATSIDTSGSSKTCVASDYTTTGFRYNKPSDQCFDWVAFGKIR